MSAAAAEQPEHPTGLRLRVITISLVLAPLISPWFIVVWYVLKAGSDRLVHASVWVSALTPLSFLLCAVLQLDSAIAHWTGRATWKGRPIARRVVEAGDRSPAP